MEEESSRIEAGKDRNGGGKGMGGRCNDRAFYLPPDQSIASSNGKGTGSQKGERLRASRLMRIRKKKKIFMLFFSEMV